MKKQITNTMIREIESKIFDALIKLGLKPSKVLEENNECHFITPKKSKYKYLSNYSLQNFYRSPLFKKSALESVQIWTFILRPNNTGRRIYPSQSQKFYYFPQHLLN